MANENINQELVVSILDKLNDTINEITADVTGQSTKLITSILEQKKNDGYFSSIALGDNSVHENNIIDEAITNNKIKSTCDNLATNIIEDKTIDTSTGKLIDETGTYVTDFIQVRNADKSIIYDNLYVNKWKNNLLWVGYGYDKTTVVKSGLGGTGTGLQRKITVRSFSSVYYVRIVGYTDLCLSSEFIVTDTEYKNIDWLKLDTTNFTNSLPSYLCNNNICTVKTDNSININIKPLESDSETNKVTLTTNKTVMAYVDNTSVKIANSGYTLTESLSTGNYGLIYNLSTETIQIVKIDKISKLKCNIISYLYIYKQNAPSIYLLGNDSKINVTWTHTVTDSSTDMDYEVSEKITDSNLDNVFTHDIYPTSKNWLNINRVGINKYATPYPFIFNSTVKAQGGMLVAQAGDCSMYNNMDNNLGGHVLQLWAKNDQYRATGILDERLPDNLPMFTLQTWITKGLSGGSSNCAYGWIKLGTDDFKIVDEVKTSEKTGVYIHPKVSIFATPVIMEAKPLLSSMPIGYEVNEDGTYKLDEENHRVKIDTSSLNPNTKLGEHYNISNKNILQVNNDNELYFHSAKDDMWHKINQDEEISSINSQIETINSSLDNLNFSADNTNNKIDTINSTLDTLNTSIETINNSISTINTELDTKDTEISTINETITSLTTEVNTLKTTTETLTSNLATLTSTVSDLSTELEELKTLVGNPTENHKSNNITYDNSVSGLTATDVYSAINELKTMIDNLSTAP